MLQHRFKTKYMYSSCIGVARFSNHEECYGSSQWAVNILILKMIPHHLQGFLFMLEISFDTDIGWLGLVTGVSTGEEGGYCEGCVVKNRDGHRLGDHVYGDGENEDAVDEVVDEGDILGFETGAVGKDPCRDGGEKCNLVGRGI